MLEWINKIAVAVFLLCVVAILILIVAENYSGLNATNETLELYDELENAIGWILVLCIAVPIAAWLGSKGP